MTTSPGPADAPGTTILSQEADPYVVDGSQVAEPPSTLRGKLTFLGPGMITAAAVVGSGELLTATALGATVGFMLLWLVLVSTFLKVWVQIELARWSISTGRTAVDGYDDVPPRIGKRGWIAWLQLLMLLQFFIGQASVISASAFAFSSHLPIGTDPYSLLSIGTWVAILVVLAIAIHSLNRYAVIERISTVFVLAVTLFAIAMVLLLQGTEFAWTLGDLGSGLRFQVAVMKVDAWVNWIVYTASTAAFYVLGAAVLHPQGLVPEGNEVMVTIS